MTREDLLETKIEFFLELTKSEHILRVRDGNTRIIREYPIAVGRYNDDKESIWAADYRTPNGAYLVTAIHERGSKGLETANRKYYPWYLAHKYGNPLEDAGYGVYGDGIIVLSYPNVIDTQRFRKAKTDGTLEREWEEFCTTHWQPIYECQAKIEDRLLEEVAIEGDFGKKTFTELYCNIPTEEDFNIPLSIHGTNNPECIGHDISAGCIRMHNEHIMELINNYVLIGTPVIINFSAIT